eukprot:m.342212 g.342212  ORF g.342212 m.342212 type:complete len:92 (-) comp21099_c0_seq1:57-332(-)
MTSNNMLSQSISKLLVLQNECAFSTSAVNNTMISNTSTILSQNNNAMLVLRGIDFNLKTKTRKLYRIWRPWRLEYDGVKRKTMPYKTKRVQ